MVFVTVTTKENPFTVYFDHPIPKPSYIRLLSSHIPNTWFNLKKNLYKIFIVKDEKDEKRKPDEVPFVSFVAAHYTLQMLVSFLKNNLAKNSIELTTDINEPLGQLVIKNNDNKKIILTHNMSNLLLGIKNVVHLGFITYIRRLNSPTTHFIHCDLVDKKQNLFNGKPSSVLACFDIGGKPYEKFNYQSSQLNVLRDVAAEKNVTSMTLSVRDEMGNRFNYNGSSLTY